MSEIPGTQNHSHDGREVEQAGHDVKEADSSEKVNDGDPERQHSPQADPPIVRRVSFLETRRLHSVEGAVGQPPDIVTHESEHQSTAKPSREETDQRLHSPADNIVPKQFSSKLELPTVGSEFLSKMASSSSCHVSEDEAASTVRQEPSWASDGDVAATAAHKSLQKPGAHVLASRVSSYGVGWEQLAMFPTEFSAAKSFPELPPKDDACVTNYKKKYERKMDVQRQLVEELRMYKLLHAVKAASVSELRQILSEDPDVELDRFGTDDFKTVEELFQEMESLRCVLERTPKGIRRVVEIVVVRICYRDLALVETHEQLPDGQVRSRNILPGAKMVLGETADDAVERFLYKELGLHLDNLSGRLHHIYTEFEKELTLSYPLCCFFRKHDLSYNIQDGSLDAAQLARIGLPAGTQFTTSESKRPTKHLTVVSANTVQRAESAPSLGAQSVTTHFWTWYKASIVEAFNYTEASERKCKTKDFDLTVTLNEVFGVHKYRSAYQNLLLQIFGTKFELQKLTGGFSGSVVLRAQPYDIDLNPVEPCIVKLDTAAKVREEFANSCKVYDVLADRAAKVLDEPIFYSCENTGEFGAFKLELAGACWHVPEFANCTTCLLSTFKDVFLYDTIQQLLPKSYLTSETPPYGSVQLIINEVLGPGGMLRSLRQKGISRSEDHIFAHYNIKGKDSLHNPFYNQSYNTSARGAMNKFYFKHFDKPLGNIRNKVLTLNERMKKLPSAKDAPESPYAQMRPLIGLSHGDLNAANILVDAMDAVWLIDFATSRDLPIFSDHCKLETCFLFEYTTVPITPAVLLGFAGGEESNEDDWFELNVCEWLHVPREVCAAFLHELQKRCQQFRKQNPENSLVELHDVVLCKNDTDLESMLKRAAGVLAGKQQTNALRQLRSRLCVDASRMAAGIGAVRTYVDNLVRFGDADDLMITPLEDLGGIFEKHKKVAGTTSVAFTAQVINRCRRYFAQDRQLTLHKVHQKMDLAPIDGSAMLLVLPLLWETFRILGFSDCAPWFKLLAAYYCDSLVDTVNAVIDNAGSDSTPLIPSTKEFSRSIKRLQSANSPRSGNLADNLNDCEDDVRTSQHIYHLALTYERSLRVDSHRLALDRALRKKIRTEHVALEKKYRISGSYCVPLAVDVEENGTDQDSYVAKLTLLPVKEMKKRSSSWPGKVFVNNNMVGYVKIDSENPEKYEFLLTNICFCDTVSVLSFYTQGDAMKSYLPPRRKSFAHQALAKRGRLHREPGGIILMMRIMWPAHRITAQLHASAPILCQNLGDRIRTRQPGFRTTVRSKKAGGSEVFGSHHSEHFWCATVEAFLAATSEYSIRFDDTHVLSEGATGTYEKIKQKHDPSHWNQAGGVGAAHYQYPPNTEFMLYLENEGWVDARIENRLPERGNRHCVEILRHQKSDATSPTCLLAAPENKRPPKRSLSAQNRSKTLAQLTPPYQSAPLQSESPEPLETNSDRQTLSRTLSTISVPDNKRDLLLPTMVHVDLNEFNHCVSRNFNAQHYDEETQRMRTFMKSRHGFIIDAISQEKLDVMKDCAPSRLFEARCNLIGGVHTQLLHSDIVSQPLRMRPVEIPALLRSSAEELSQRKSAHPTLIIGSGAHDGKREHLDHDTDASSSARQGDSATSAETPHTSIEQSLSKSSAPSSNICVISEENRALFLEKQIRSTDKRHLGWCRPRAFVVVGPRESGKTCFMKRITVNTLSCQTDIIPLFISVSSFSSLVGSKTAQFAKPSLLSPTTYSGAHNDRFHISQRFGSDDIANSHLDSTPDSPETHETFGATLDNSRGKKEQEEEEMEMVIEENPLIAERDLSDDAKQRPADMCESDHSSSSEFFVSNQTTGFGSCSGDPRSSHSHSYGIPRSVSKFSSQLPQLEDRAGSFDDTMDMSEHQTTSHAMDMVDQYFRHLYGEESTRYTLICNAINSHRVLFLFDYDEGEKLDPLVESCFVSLAAQFHPLVISCRPEVIEDTDLVRLTHLFHLYELQYLDQMQQRAIILARLGQKNTVHFRAFLNRFHDQLGDDCSGEDAVLLRLPAMLSMLLCYWQRERLKRSCEGDPVAGRNRRVLQAPQDVSISEVFRVATDVLVNRVQQKQQADRHKAKSRQRHFHQVLQRIAFQLQTLRRRLFTENEPSGWLPCHLLDVWTDLRSAINAGQIALVMASNKEGNLQMRFAFYSYQKYLAACCIVDEDFGDENFNFTIGDIISDQWWSEVMDILVEKWPTRYQKLVIQLLRSDIAAKEMSETYIHMAARCEHTPLFRVLKDMPEDVRKQINKPDAASWTPLHVAADNGNALICSLLIQNKADVTNTTRKGWTPLFYAVAKHHSKARALLLEALRAHKPHERNRSYSKLILYGLNLGERILSPTEEMSDEQFIRKLERRFPEINYFRGRSDTTPDASAHSVQLGPAEIEYRRTLVAMLSVYWICSDQRDRFIRSQGSSPITISSWAAIQKWCRETVKLATPSAVNAMLSFMAIHDLGKLSDFRGDLAPGIHDHDVAISRIVDEFPEVLPSYMSLDSKHQELVAAAVKVKFNFGQFLQAENLPANLLSMKELLGEQGPGALAFYLFHIFADICGIMGAQTQEGSKFMTETMYHNFRLGADVLQQLSLSSPNEVYDAFLRKRAERQGLELNNAVDRAIARLACCCRCFNEEGGALVKEEFLQLPTEERERLTAYLNVDGIEERPGFLLYYAPAFLENAMKNEEVGLRRALLLMLKVYDLSAKAYPYTLSSVISIHIGDLASWSSTCGSSRMFDNTFIQITRGTEHTESKILISPWCHYDQPSKLDTDGSLVKAHLKGILGLSVMPSAEKNVDELRVLHKLYPELLYFATPTLLSANDLPPQEGMSSVAKWFYRLLNSILGVLWILGGKYEQFTQCQTLTKDKHLVLTEKVFEEIHKWMLNAAKTGPQQPADFIDFVDASITFMILVNLPKIDAFRQDFSPSKDPDASSDGAILANAIAAKNAYFPSFERLPEKYKRWIRSSADINFDFIQFIHAQNMPANLKPLRECMEEDEQLNFALFHICAKSLGHSGHNSLDGCLYFDEVITSTAVLGLGVLSGLRRRRVTETYNLYLLKRATTTGLYFDNSSDRRALLRIACFARMASPRAVQVPIEPGIPETSETDIVSDRPFSVQLAAAMEALQPDERVRLVEFLNRDGIEWSRPAFLLGDIPKVFENALANPVIGLTRAVRLCLNMYETAAVEYEHSKERVITIRAKELALFVQSYRSTVSIYDVRLDIYRCEGTRGERECSVSARPWVPVKNPEVLSQLKVDGIAFAKSVLNGSISETQFLAQAKRIFPELNYFRGKTDSTPDASASVQTLPDAEIEYRRTLGAMLSVYWVLTDQHHRFVRGQKPEDRLTKQSWENLRYWTKNVVNLTTASAVDTILCFMALHDLGKMTHLRQDLAPGYQDHDQALDYILTEHPDVLPSFQRLDPDDQKLIRASVNVKFNLGQFLQAENLPANLIAVKDLGKTSDSALGFYLFHIFADMSGILGAKTLEGSVFMTETMYANFKRGLDVLQTLSSNSVDHSYDAFLQQRGILCFSTFSSGEERALVRLACCARVFNQTGGMQVQEAFMSLFTDERRQLTNFLNADGVTQRPGYLLYYAPAFLEYCRNSQVIGLARGMRMLLRIYATASQEYVNTQEPVVTIFIDKFAREVKDCECADVFDNIVFYIKRSPGEHGNVEACAMIDHRATEQKTLAARQALRNRIPFDFIYHDALELNGVKVDLTDFFKTQKELIGLHCTTSCYSMWEKNDKVNSFGKIIPCVQDPDLDYNVFYFDDNLQFDAGGPHDSGICNLRLQDGTYVDFSLNGPNGFNQEKFAANTTIQYSRTLPIVLVKVCILDVLQDENYFTKIVNRFSKPAEQLIIHMDVNGTVVLGDIMNGKNTESTVLSALFEFTNIVALEDCEFNWMGSVVNIARDSKSTLKHVVKKIVPSHEYRRFWTDNTPWDFLREIESIKGISLRFQGKNVLPEGFHQIHLDHMKQLNLTWRGICRSWLELVREYRERCLIMLNTFGVDSRKVLRVTLEETTGKLDTEDVSMIVINNNEWSESDRVQFNDYFVDASEEPFSNAVSHDDTNLQRTSLSGSDGLNAVQKTVSESS
eukprot:GEMP01000013.1.p1 GENE.GEMP01000013.1~~GEMP01000013.1.p1  ORF type:complete len:4104 (+),score=709.09 GEMP01000013.1:293-12604(+)